MHNKITERLKKILFPGYFGDNNTAYYREHVIGELEYISAKLREQCREAYMYGSGGEMSPGEAEKKASDSVALFIENLPSVQRALAKDVTALYNGDPAAKTKAEIIVSYPGLYAIFMYRAAHVLYKARVPLIPRIMTEHAHSLTGIDINSGAEIGEYFFIDHGTGVVIGETTVIGNNVKLYQGVTLGALSTRKGQQLSGLKRHPTICDNVTIYSDATILGGDTVIGQGATIGGNAFIVKSVPAGMKITSE